MRFIVVSVALSLVATEALATYSIAACDGDTGECGVAVATHNLAVGASVPFAEAGVGAGVSQFETNPIHKQVILDVLRNESDAAQALQQALANDQKFSDGQDKTFRQIGVVAYLGNVAAHTGAEAGPWAGHLLSNGVSIQGNGLWSKEVLSDMADAFEDAEGPLANRLLVALEAGHAAGGQTIGVTSAALLVSHPEGWPLDVNLRIDFSSPSAVEDLRRVYDARRAFDLMIRARNATRSGNLSEAQATVETALTLAPQWDRIWLRAARLAESWDDHETVALRMCRFYEINPVWAKQLMSEKEVSVCK
ncbi:MAG: DUF1028 domain-containing protein [Pseudomonadota bacterium]